MNDDFTRRLEYGLNDLPEVAADDYSSFFAPTGLASMGMQRDGAQLVPARFGFFRQRPGPSPRPAPGPPAPLPTLPYWLKRLEEGGQLFPRVTPRSGSGGKHVYDRCMEAAKGDVGDWENFCRSIGSEENNVAGGGQKARSACFDKSLLSRTEKENWCRNQYGPDARE